MSYRDDRQWADQFIPEIKRIVGPLLLEPAAFELDAKEATDLIVLRAHDMRIAARMRKHGYFDSYGNQFTIRCRRDSGAKTELFKIVNGWGDWMFYGHAAIEHGKIDHWMIVDLHAFRAGLIRNAMNGKKIRCGQMPNGDGTHFKWFDYVSFPETPPILVSASEEVLAFRDDPFLRACRRVG